MSIDSAQASKDNKAKIESWCRKVAFLITQAGQKEPSAQLEDSLLNSLARNALEDLEKYFLRCNGVRYVTSRHSHSDDKIKTSIKEVILKVRNKEIGLRLPDEMASFISPSGMYEIVGKVSGMTKAEIISDIRAEAEKIINTDVIIIPNAKKIKRLFKPSEIHEDSYRGKEVVAISRNHGAICPMIAPELKNHFIAMFGKVPMLPDKKKGVWISVSDLLGEIRLGGDAFTKTNLEELKEFIQKLSHSNADLRITDEGEKIHALSHIQTYAYNPARSEAIFLSPEAQKYVKYNYMEAKKRLTDGDNFITSTPICEALGVGASKENRAIAQLILGEERESRKFDKLMLVDGSNEREFQVGDLVRRLSSKGIQPSFFIHKAALEEPFISSDQAIITKQMVVDRRNELRASKTSPVELLEQTSARGR